jgi:hypothetical protein
MSWKLDFFCKASKESRIEEAFDFVLESPVQN